MHCLLIVLTKRVIESCLMLNPDIGYFRARELLQSRFGDPFEISQLWILKVTEGSSIHTKEQILDYADNLRSCINCLGGMGYMDELNNQSTLQKIMTRLPHYLKTRWLREVQLIKDRQHRNPNIEDVTMFVEKAAKESNDPVFGSMISSRHNSVRVPSSKTLSYNVSVNDDNYKRTSKCIACKDNHLLYQCKIFRAMSVINRRNLVQEGKLCFNCMRPGHMARDCKMERVCGIDGCDRKHSRFLHKKEKADYDDTTKKQDEASNHSINSCTGKIALPVVPVIVLSHKTNHSVRTLALLDSGSTHTFCSEELVNKLNLKGDEAKIKLTTLNKTDHTVPTKRVNLSISPVDNENVKYHLKSVYTQPKISVKEQHIADSKEILNYSYMSEVNLPQGTPKSVSLIIGQDNPHLLTPLEVKRGNPGEPVATKTLLGWSISGPLNSGYDEDVSSHFIENDVLSQQLETFWKLEGDNLLADESKAMSINDQKALKLWSDAPNEDNHYVAKIPFKSNTTLLPNNRSHALSRLHSLNKRLQKNEWLKNKYTAEMKRMLERGYAEEIPLKQECEEDATVWYLPHQPVLNPQKPDKCRIVFDCAAKFNDTSLNKHVHQGPDLANKLIGVLLRFRQQPIAITSDIAEMFHQVKVIPGHRDALRFLWYDQDNKIAEYRMTVHLFGGNWSPACCNYFLQRSALDNAELCDSSTLSTVMNNFYVDDCLKSVATEEEAIQLFRNLTLVLSKGGFKLTKWNTNNRNVLKAIPNKDCVVDIDVTGTLPPEKVLGIYWNIEDDIFTFRTRPIDKPFTRRGVLSVMCSIYDPLGLASPVIIIAKMLVQEFTRLKLGWDDPLPETHREVWNNWLKEIDHLSNLEVPRWYNMTSTQGGAFELHHFADSSSKAYGVVSYLRYVNGSDIKTTLIFSKARLTPIKSVTIPRLELVAAALAVKIDKMLRKELEIEIVSSVFWTDSMIVLQYIDNSDKRFQTFVANRISLIRECSNPEQWHHIKSQENPADCVSRGMHAKELVKNKAWIHGPEILSQDIQYQLREKNDHLRDDCEVKNSSTIYAAMLEDDVVFNLAKCCSTLYKLKNTIAWILRVKQWLTGNRDTNICSQPLTAKELMKAEDELIKYVQRIVFQEEIQKITSNADNTRKSLRHSPIYKLNPLMVNGFLCVGGRLTHSTIPIQQKHPMILPKHHISELIIQQYHEKAHHAGREHVLALTRERFWIIKGRVLTRKVLRRCPRCIKSRATPGIQKMNDLPMDRISPGGTPFDNVGLDVFGPFMVKRGRSQVKRYGCIFTCLLTRAIHIEVLMSLESDSFINGLRRFICRRGKPKLIRSDNGTNFVAAERILRESVQQWNSNNKINNYVQQNEIEWIFNTPSASHHGGCWERMIKSVRRVLGFITKDHVFEDEQLLTIMCEAEFIINSRPLTTVSDDSQDPEPLTPNHLLIMKHEITQTPGEFVKQDIYRSKWKNVQYLLEVFWKRWTSEYLNILQQRSKWNEERPNIRKDDIVLIVDDCHRGQWKIARVVEVYPGKDGLVRSAKVKSSDTTLLRPITKLCLLELSQ